MNKILRVTLLSVITLLPLLLIETLVVPPVFADTVSVTGNPIPTKQGWKVNLNVTNTGDDTRAIFDFHVSVTGGAKILRTSKPKGWKCQWGILKPYEVEWKTNARRALLNGQSETGFDIITDQPNYTVYWQTTDENGKVIDSGSFPVSP